MDPSLCRTARLAMPAGPRHIQVGMASWAGWCLWWCVENDEEMHVAAWAIVSLRLGGCEEAVDWEVAC